MSVQIIEKDGRPEYAVLPYEEYQRLLEALDDARDAAALEVFGERLTDGEEELLPVALVDRLIAGEHPVRVWREYRGMTLQQLADACGVTNPAISQIERGRRQPSLDLLRAMARALRVGLDDLVRREKGVELDSSEAG